MNPEEHPDYGEPDLPASYGLTTQELVSAIVEFEIHMMPWGDIQQVLAETIAKRLVSMPPEALQDRYDSIFNR